MKKIIISIIILLLLAVGIFTCYILFAKGRSCDDSAKEMFKAIANNDPHAFNWMTVEELDELNGTDTEALGKIRTFLSDIDKNVPPLLAEWRKLGEEAGINWQDIKVDSVDYNSADINDYERMGCDVRDGFILAESNGRKFKIVFEQALETFFEFRTMALTHFLPLDEKGKVISSMSLKQDGTFDEFYHSLAECVDGLQDKEIEKIFLTNPKGDVIFQIPSFEPNFEQFINDWWPSQLWGMRNKMVKQVEEKDYEAIVLDKSMLLEFGMVDNYGLDKEEIGKAELMRVGLNLKKEDPPMNVICGKFMKYKGKWYYIGDFNSSYEPLHAM